MNGHGKVKVNGSLFYEGEFKDGFPHGYGVFYHKYGIMYHGNFIRGVLHDKFVEITGP